jgi:RNA polymerase sigma factor (sigma-70 family)
VDAEERRALFAANQGEIRRAARRFSAPGDDVDDIVQDTAVILFAHDRGPPDEEAFVGWCCGVARHLALHRRRSQAQTALLKACLQHYSLPFVDGDPERVVATRKRLEVGLDRLDEDALSLLWKRFALEETSVEVASDLNVSAASVRMRLTRLVARVRESEKSTEDSSIDGCTPRSSGN